MNYCLPMILHRPKVSLGQAERVPYLFGETRGMAAVAGESPKGTNMSSLGWRSRATRGDVMSRRSDPKGVETDSLS